MSAPARQLAPEPRRRPARPRGAPATGPKSTKTSAARPRHSTPSQTARRARRGHRTAFWLLSGVLVSAMVVGLVAINALTVQTTYHMHQFQQGVTDLSAQQIELTERVAALSAPGRIAAWAAANGMQLPGPRDTVVLRVPGVASAPDGPGNP